MTSDLETRVRGANPIGRDGELDRLFGDDLSERLFRQIRRGRVARMADTDQQPTPLHVTGPDQVTPRRTPARRGLLVGAGLVVVAVLIGVVAVLTSGDDATTGVADAPVTDVTSAPTTTVAVTIDAAGAVAAVEASFAAFNVGDIDAWLAFFSDDATFFGARQETAVEEFAPLFAANPRLELIEPCRSEEATADGDRVVACTYTNTNDFHAAGGLIWNVETTFVLNDQGLIRATGPGLLAGPWEETSRYNTLFWLWLETAHPDVHEQIELTPSPVTRTDRLPETPERMRMALEYVDEFVAQSDDYSPAGS